MTTVTCYITNKEVPESEAVRGSQMRESIIAFIRRKFPDFSLDDYISDKEYNAFRRQYLYDLMSAENQDITAIEQAVVNAIANNKILSEDIEPELDKKLSIGQRAADVIAEFGGSWKFIIAFFLMLVLWILMNVWFLGKERFDPYPFILLNLILSCLAAIQAPIIMMSQNRQEQKDRLRGENDYKINLKAELEIKILHEKIDHLTFIQQRRLLEIQQLQIDYLDEIVMDLRVKKEE